MKNFKKDLSGEKIGGSVLEELLAKGGMSQIYKAHLLEDEKDIAVKILPPEMVTRSEWIMRFKNEGETLAKLKHQNIVKIHKYGNEDNYYYIQMELLEGKSLREIIEEVKYLRSETVLFIVKQVCEGLLKAHKSGIIHRDIKPSNIFITYKGVVKVIDFGLLKDLARSTKIIKSNEILGTPYYMSPEKCEGQPTDKRTDIYSLGITLFHLLTGELPYKSKKPLDILYDHVDPNKIVPNEKKKFLPEIRTKINNVKRIMEKR